MISASSPKESASAVNGDHGNNDARARALYRRDIFAHSGANAPASFALARVENRAFTDAAPALALALARDQAGAAAHAPALAPAPAHPPEITLNQAQSRKRYNDADTLKAFPRHSLPHVSESNRATYSVPARFDNVHSDFNARSPAPNHSIKKVSDSNEANNHMSYGLAALAIGGLTLGCASALGAGLVPLAVAASVLILATVAVGAVAVGAGSSPSSSPRTASHSGRVPSAASSGGVSI